MSTNQWIPVYTGYPEGMPEYPAYAVDDTLNRCYFAGGRLAGRPSAISYYFDANDNNWYDLPNLNVVRENGRMAAWEGKIYYMGGQELYGTNSRKSSSVIEVYDPSVGHWERLPDMPFTRALMGCVVAEDKLYMLGGIERVGGSITPCDTLYVYDFITGDWEQKSGTNGPVVWSQPVIHGKTIYVYGGYRSNSLTTVFRDIYKYDIDSDSWTSAGFVPQGLSVSPQQAGSVLYFSKEEGNALVRHPIDGDDWVPTTETNYDLYIWPYLNDKLYNINIWSGNKGVEYYSTKDDPTPPGPCLPVHGCANVEIKITGCSNNAMIKRISQVIDESECECDCDCSCNSDHK